ncbi:MAG: cysteine desulfurase [Verrucomicrobiaceae bacterium]|nr:cysteine desulfurase [Verrucomicrobiaceae bacterium]
MEPKAQNPDPRSDFPILRREVKGKPLVYLDNAATTQKPQVVIDRVSGFLANENANIHRGVHYLSMEATDAYDRARAKVAGFLNAAEAREIVFTRGTTEAINLVARSFALPRMASGDEILISAMEHHANIVPWQMAAKECGALLRVAPLTDCGQIDLEAYGELLGERTRLVALTHVSNVLGTINPAKEMIAMAKELNIPVLLDGAQAVPHISVDVRELNCDFYTFSSHKLFGPDGVGILYGRAELLAAMPPYQGGGDMIEQVSFENTTFRAPPERFEAGTPNISGAIGLGAAIDYISALGRETIHAREEQLLNYATNRLGEVPGLSIRGTAPEKVAVISFTLESAHPHDIGTILDASGIAIRAGHHCAQPLMQHLGVPATARASFAFYNTTEEIDRLTEALLEVNRMFGT